MKRLRVGVMGQGRSGFSIHVKSLQKDPEKWEIAAVADEMPERLTDSAETFGAATFADYKELIANAKELELDLIVNALPSFLHPKGTIEALEAGFDVVCEKPLARTVADVDKMVATAEAGGRTLLPFQNSRFQPAFQKVLEIVESGKLGELIQVRINFSGWSRRWDWQCLQEFWGGNLLNTGPHPMDQAIVLFGDGTPNVFARLVSVNPWGDAENFVAVTIWGDNAPTIEVAVSSFQAYPQGDIYNIGGTKGGLTGSTSSLKWKYYDEKVAPVQENKGEWSPNRNYCSEKLDWIEEQWSLTSGLGMFDLICRGFYDNAYDILVNGGDRVITLDQVRRQVGVMEEAHRQNPMARWKPFRS